MEDNIFTKIINGDIPCYKVYEDDRTLAFLDIHPVQPGHVLVISKSQVEFLWDLEDSDYSSLMQAVKKVGSRLRVQMGKPYVGVKVVGIDVPHAHIHLIPFTTKYEYDALPNLDIGPSSEYFKNLASQLFFS